MATVAVIGEETRVEGFRLTGALVYPAEDERAVRRAWRALGPDVAVVVLTPRAARILEGLEGAVAPRPGPGDGPLPVVMP